MLARPTGRYNVLRGETVNEYGDSISSETVAVSGIRGSVIERTRTVYNEDSGRVATVRYYTGRFPHGTDIRSGDRIRGADGTEYLVTGINSGSTVINKPDLVVSLDTVVA